MNKLLAKIFANGNNRFNTNEENLINKQASVNEKRKASKQAQ